MKKLLLPLSALVPVLVGYLVNHTLALGGVGTAIFMTAPLLTTAFWAFLGWQYAQAGWRLFPAVLTANSLGILSLGVYLWQFLARTDETRDLMLAGASQMFCAATPTWLLARIAILFESQPNFVGRASMTALQVVGLLYMIAVFACGYAAKRFAAKHLL